MYNRAVDGWRSRARRPEVLGLPAGAAVVDHASRLDLRLSLIAALELLTPRQRAAVVARYWEQLSEAETAEALGCSVSAVKAAAARGLRTLREAMASDVEYAPELTVKEAGL
jgi:RNA polymerase sigma factor (sigma-70 family)